MRISDWSSDVCSPDLSQQRKAPLRCAGLQQCRMENIERTDGDPPLAQMMTPRFIEMCQRIIKHVARQYPARVGKLRQYRAQWRCNRSVARLLGHGEDRKSTRLNSSH